MKTLVAISIIVMETDVPLIPNIGGSTVINIQAYREKKQYLIDGIEPHNGRTILAVTLSQIIPDDYHRDT